MPYGASRLVGRERELETLKARARERRLVTLIGPGGVGKTALAQVAAEQIATEFPSGVRHVDLTRVSDPTAVMGAIASQLGFDSFDALIGSPVDQPALIVMDNCEHLQDAAATAIEELLGASRQLTIIATSRTPLELPAESIISLTRLALPAIGQDPRDCSSVALFLERARDASGYIAHTDIDLVVELCRRLDGLPLAIELAAARTRTRTITEITESFDHDIASLEWPRFRGEPRHRSLAATIQWSFELLSPSQRSLIEQLAVFAGPFPASIARAVTGNPQSFATDLDELIHASLAVVVDSMAAETRYRLLDTVRRYAFDRLVASDGVDDAMDRFVDHTLDRTLALLTDLFSQTWRAELIHDFFDIYEDVVQAVRWCISHDDTPRRSHLLCLSFVVILHHGRADEITELMRRLVVRFPDRDTIIGAAAWAVLATGEYVTGNLATGIEIASRTLDEHPGPDDSTVSLQRVLGRARNALGDDAGAIEAFRSGARIGRELGMTAIAQELEVGAALVGADAGRVDEGLVEVTAIVAAARADGSLGSAAWASAARSWMLVRVDPAAALIAAENDLSEAQTIDYPIGVAVCFRTKAFAHLLLGDIAGATATVDELLGDLLARGALSNLRVVVDVTAALAYRCGHPSWESLAATARALPITTPACSLLEVIPLPPVSAAPLGRTEVVNTVRATLDDIAGGHSPMPAMHTAPTTARMETRGELCEIDFESRVVAVRTSKGLADIARLVAAGGREVHCTELAGVSVEQSSTGDVLDATARRQYEDRIRELQDDIDVADRDNDYGRSYRLQVELDMIIEHLTSSLSLGQRTRRGTDNTERARSAVTHRLRTTIRQLHKVHPTLGAHLEHSIHTGTYCTYRPEHPITWTVKSG